MTAEQTTPIALVSFIEGEGSPLIMLGGGTLGAGEFALHARRLGRDFRVVRLQTLNVDRAQKKQPLPAGYSLKTESGAMARALDQLGLTTPLDIVAHSFGGLVALDFALDHPDRVRTLILAEPPAFWAVPVEELRATGEMRTMYELLREFVPATEPTDDHFMRFLRAIGSGNIKAPAGAGAGLRGFSVIVDHTDDVSRLKNFRRPVLLITGSSTISFHRRIDDILATYLPLAERTELPGDHAAPVSAPEKFIGQIKGFLTRHPG